MNKIRILLADDHALVRQGTRQLLEREADLEVVAEAGDGEEAVRLARAHSPDVVVMDLAMPVLNGIEATKQIKALNPRISVLALTAYDDDPYIFALLEAGGAGYLLKNVSADELIRAIRAVAAGEAVLHPAIARRVVNRFASSGQKPDTVNALDQLTEREIEVLRLAARGLKNQEIAQELSLSIRTVQTHLGNIFNKMGVGSRTEAVIEALRRGWLTLQDIL
ncbi:MAG: response regulator transcription factor [Anaerolineae bacterium]|nr:response regulator transcription factor [Anaerolineae bacterium]